MCVSVCVCVISKSLPSSAENTINRPRQTQSGPGQASTQHVDRGLHHPPPYTSSTSLTTPYHVPDDVHGLYQHHRLSVHFTDDAVPRDG